jgi:hypothetical protein
MRPIDHTHTVYQGRGNLPSICSRRQRDAAHRGHQPITRITSPSRRRRRPPTRNPRCASPATCGRKSRERHPGVLVAKVGYFGVKSTKVHRVQMGTKPAKVGRLGPRCAKVRRSLHAAPTGASAKRSSIHAASKVAKRRCRGRTKVAKVGPSELSDEALISAHLRADLCWRVQKCGAKRRVLLADVFELGSAASSAFALRSLDRACAYF